MGTKFKIEATNVDGQHGCVRASIVEGKFFAVSQGSELGGVRLRSVLHEQNSTTFLFELENSGDATKMKIGSIVELE